MNGTRMFRINIFHHYTGLGGASKSLLILCDSLVSNGYLDIEVYLGTKGDNWVNIELSKRGIKTTSLPILYPYPVVNGTYKFAPLRLIESCIYNITAYGNKKRVRRANINIFNSITLFHATQLICKADRNLIIQRETFHRKYISSFCYRYLIRNLTKFSAIVHISSFDKDQLKLSVDQHVLPNIPGDNSSRNIVKGEQSNKLFFAGGYNQIKGLYKFLESYRYSKCTIPLILNVPKPNRKNAEAVLLKKSSRYKYNCQKLIQSLLDEGRELEFSNDSDIPWAKFKYLAIWPTVPHQLRLIRECYINEKTLICPKIENYQEFIDDSRTLQFNDALELSNILDSLPTLKLSYETKVENYSIDDYGKSLMRILVDD